MEASQQSTSMPEVGNTVPVAVQQWPHATAGRHAVHSIVSVTRAAVAGMVPRVCHPFRPVYAPRRIGNLPQQQCIMEQVDPMWLVGQAACQHAPLQLKQCKAIRQQQTLVECVGMTKSSPHLAQGLCKQKPKAASGC